MVRKAGEVLRLLRTNASAKSFYQNIYNFKRRLRARGYPHNLTEKIPSEFKFTELKSALEKNNEVRKRILPFVKTVVSWCCESPNDVTFRPFCVSHYHKVQVFIQPLQILFSANECKISVGLSVPTNSLTTFDLIKQGFN